MVRKLAAAAMVSGALILGVGGVAFGATAGPGGAGAAGTAPGARSCSLAPKALARLERLDGRITKVLPKLQSAEQRANQAGHQKLAARIGRRQTRLERRQSRLEARIARIEQRCPGAASGTQAPAGGGSSSSAA